tara:strand:- start:14 stop:397 length:384 start_codon:yes stop_codon:yes gene_type:complete
MTFPPREVLINMGFSYLFDGQFYNDRPDINMMKKLKLLPEENTKFEFIKNKQEASGIIKKQLATIGYEVLNIKVNYPEQEPEIDWDTANKGRQTWLHIQKTKYEIEQKYQISNKENKYNNWKIISKL